MEDKLRSKKDANEYKDYLLGIVFYKYLSDSFLIKVYDLICDEKPETLKFELALLLFNETDCEM
jgi:type I restriction enzyme M protein